MRTLGLGLCLSLLIFCGNALAAKKKPPCFKPLSSCPLRGCAKEDAPDSFSNILKHNLEPSGDVKTLTFKDFESLQAQVETKFGGHYSTLTKPDRARLRKLTTSAGQVGEGNLVRIIGFIAVQPSTSEPHANESGESVNCRLTGGGNNDFHISLTPKPDGSEFDGIVVEMIPQQRNQDWTTGRLKKAQQEHRAVRVRGQLFFDNHHKVNSDPAQKITNQPKRMSLWEVHPVTEFDVCTKASCEANGSGWTPLEKWQPGAHP